MTTSTLTDTAIAAAAHGDTDFAATLTVLERWLAAPAHVETHDDACWVVIDTAGRWTRDGDVGLVKITPAQAGRLAARIEGGRVEVSPSGTPCVSVPGMGRLFLDLKAD